MIIGELAVLLSARTAPFIRDMNTVAASVEKTVRQVKKATSDISNAGMGAAGAIAAAFALSSQSSFGANRAMNQLKENTTALAQEITRLALPAIQGITQFVNHLVGALQSISPGTRQLISNFLEWGAAITAAAFAVNKLVGLAEGLAGIAKIFASLGVALGPLILALGAVWAASAFLRNAFSEDFSAIAEYVAGAMASIQSSASMALRAFRPMLDRVMDWFEDTFATVKAVVLRNMLACVAALGLIGDALAKDLGPLVGDKIKSATSEVMSALASMLNYANHLTTRNGLSEFWEDAQSATSKALATMKKDMQGFTTFMREWASKTGNTDFRPLSAMTSHSGLDVTGGLSLMSANAASVQALAGFQSTPSNRINRVSSVGGSEARLNAMAINDADHLRSLQAMDAIIAKFSSKLSRLGEVIGTASEGFQAGGIWGAVLAVIADILSSAKQFEQVIQLVDNGFQFLADAFGRLMDPLVDASASANVLMQTFINLLNPILDVLIDAFMDSATLFQGAAVLLQVFGPVLEVVFQALGYVLKALTDIVELIHRSIFNSIRALALSIVGTAKAIAVAWNWVVDQISTLLRAMKLNDWADSVQKAKISMGGLDGALNTLWDTTWEVATAQSEAAAASQLAAKETKKFAEEITNAPSGFRVAAARFNSQNPSGVSMLPGAGGGGINIYVNGNVVGVDDLAAEITDAQKRAQWQRTRAGF